MYYQRCASFGLESSEPNDHGGFGLFPKMRRRVLIFVLTLALVGILVVRVTQHGSGSPWSFAQGTSATNGIDVGEISCPTSSFCGVVGMSRAGTWKNGVLQSRRILPKQKPVTLKPLVVSISDYFTDISCPTSGFCVAVTANGKVVYYMHDHWIMGQRVTTSKYEGLDTISCVSQTFCMAGSTFDVGYIFDGTNWSDVGSPQPAAARGAYAAIRSLACTGDQECFVGTAYTNQEFDYSGQIFFFSHGYWSRASRSIDPGIASLACLNELTCIAGTTAGEYLTMEYSGFGNFVWSDPAPISQSEASHYNSIDGAACPANGMSCYLLSSDGTVFEYSFVTGQAGSGVLAVPGAEVVGSALSCSPSAVCFIGDYQIYTRTL